MIILLAPEKLITSTLVDEWNQLEKLDPVLFTSYSDHYQTFLKEQMNGLFKYVEFFHDYPNNDLIELKLLEYARQYQVENIIPMTEADILRVSKVKAKLCMQGLAYTNAILFRDKIAMKERAKQYNVNLPQFKRIQYATDLIEFIEEVGYPIVVKPILGRGSLNTMRISDDTHLQELLSKGLISKTSRYPDLLAEAYLDAEIYHIDGLQIDNKIKIISVSKYINNCLSFVGGSYLGSYTLDRFNPLRNELISYANFLIQEVFPFYKNSLFHIEVFVDSANKISLCEVACRIGGNGINDEVKLQQGIDIKMEFIKAECGLINHSPESTTTLHPIAGRLLVPPKAAKLIAFPQGCDVPGVVKYQFRGEEGKIYKKMTMSNDEIANFLITSGSEEEMCEKIMQLVDWSNQHILWEY